MDKKTMYKLTYGLFVLTSKENNFDNGCIINTAIQVTSEPNQISITVNKSNYTCDMIKNSGVFNISVISEEASFELFKRFGFQSGKDVDKFLDYKEYKRSENGIVYITEGVNGYISADVTGSVDLGTHITFFAKVTDMAVLTEKSSATYAYYQEHIKPKPQQKEENHKTVWRCEVCGYEYEGEELPADFICPLCKHPASDFVKV